MTSKSTAKVAGSQVDLKPVKIEAPKIMHRPPFGQIAGSKSQRSLDMENQLLADTSQLSTIQGQSSQRSFTNRAENYSSLPRLVLSSLCEPATEEKADSATGFQDYYEVSLDKVVTFGGENYNPNLNTDLQFDFLDHKQSENKVTNDQPQQKGTQRKSKSSPKSFKSKKDSKIAETELAKQKQHTVDEKPIKLKKKRDRPKSQRLPKPETKQTSALSKNSNQIVTIKELDEEYLGSTVQVTRKASPSNVKRQHQQVDDLAQLLILEQKSDYTTITSAGEFKLPRMKLSSQYNSLQTGRSLPEELQYSSESRAPSPELLKQSPIKVQLQQNIINQAKSFASATTKLETARGSNQSNSHADLHIKEFCLSDPEILKQTTTQREEEAQKLASMFYSTRLVTLTMKHWSSVLQQKKVQRQIVETQKQSADQLFQYLTKQKVFNSLRISKDKSVTRKSVLIGILGRLQLKKLRFGFNKYRQQCLLSRADQSYRIKLTFNAFRCLLAHAKSRSCQHQAMRIYQRALLGKSLANMLAYRDQRLQKGYSRQRAETLITQRNHLKLQSVLRHLLDYTVFRRQLRQTTAVSTQRLMFRCIQILQNNVDLQQQKRDFVKLVLGFSRCKLASRAIKNLIKGIQNQIQQREDRVREFMTYRKRLVFRNLVRRLNKSQISSSAKTKLTWAAQIWLEFSIGPVMNRVWLDFPRQKLAFTNGKPNLLLNYLRIDKRPRYKDFFEQVNTKLRLNMLAKVFDHLFITSARSSQFRRRLRRNYTHKIFTSLVYTIHRQAKIRKVVAHRSQIKKSKLVGEVFEQLYSVCRQRKTVRAKHDLIKNLHAYNTARTHFEQWHYLRRKLSYLNQQEKVSMMIMRSKIYSEYMRRWLNALHQKLKNRSCDKIGQKVILRRTAKSFVKWRNAFLWRRTKSNQFS